MFYKRVNGVTFVTMLHNVTETFITWTLVNDVEQKQGSAHSQKNKKYN